MHEPPLIAGLAVNLLVPLLGVMAYVLLCGKMLRLGIEMPPVISWFVLFAVYGAWLIVVLTGFFWEWSGMASLGVFFLLLGAPFLTLGIALILRKRWAISIFHRTAFVMSAFYTCLMPVLLIVWIGFWLFYRT
jgi:hypothetical protein